MFKLIKYLKKSIFPILIIIGLLVGQAICDLTLPDYTSRIVNVGIQQGGIEDAAYDAIRKSEFEKISHFLEESDQKKVLSYYQLITKQSGDYEHYIEKYPILEKEDLYIRTTNKKQEKEEIHQLLRKAVVIVYNLNNNQEQADQMKQEILQGKEFPDQASIFDVLKTLPIEAKKQINQKIEEQLQNYPDTMLDQASIMAVKNEYQMIGVNTDSLQTNYVIWSGLKMLAIALISMLATIAVAFLGSRVAARLSRDLRSQVFKKVLSFSNTEMKEFSTASLITRSTNDIQQIQMLIVMLLRIVFYAPIIGVGGVIKVTNTDTSMAWIVAVAVMSIMSLIVVLFALVMPKFKVIQKLIDKLNLVSREILEGIPVIRAFSTQKHEETRFNEANKSLMKTQLFAQRVMSFMMPAMLFIMNTIAIVIVWNGAHSIDEGTMQVGNLMAFIQYTMQIIMSFLMISMISIMLPRASISARRIDEVLSKELVVKDPENPESFDETKKGYIEFKDVSFRYPDAEADVISEISFIAKPGQTTAFIGSTGSGKSTLINLIPRFFDVTSGSIRVDGVDIRKVSQHALREKIGYVPQKGILFSGTIASNIRYGIPSLAEEEMKQAAHIAQATDFIEGKEEKYNDPIAQGGTNVSGGQKQRLSIARVVAKKPEIYIFDDSFSALDFKTDASLRAALKESTKDSTVLIVAQRISTIMHAEQIVVLDEGRIVGIGTHKELLKNCDIYYQIASSQLSKEELENA